MEDKINTGHDLVEIEINYEKSFLYQNEKDLRLVLNVDIVNTTNQFLKTEYAVLLGKPNPKFEMLDLKIEKEERLSSLSNSTSVDETFLRISPDEKRNVILIVTNLDENKDWHIGIGGGGYMFIDKAQLRKPDSSVRFRFIKAKQQYDKSFIEITSLEQYISEIKKIALSKSETAFPGVYFRGEADVNWETKASLFRGEIGKASYYKDVNYSKESDLIASALIQCPQAFEKCPNAISRLILMQHYGLPTRLYDVTADPLVALYFACNIEPDKDGKVLYTKQNQYFKLYSSDFVNPLAELNEEIENDEEIMELHKLFSYCKKKKLFSEFQKDEFAKWLFQNATKPFLFQPPLDNERIQRQSGAMIFSPLLSMTDKLEEENYKKIKHSVNLYEETKQFEFMKSEADLQEMFSDEVFLIPKNLKKSILHELEMVGINEASMFPELEHQFKTIKYQNVPKSETDLIETEKFIKSQT